MKTYEEMLDELYSKLPDKVKSTGERFEIPKLDIFMEGKNTTIWRNFRKIAEVLRRDAGKMAKYFSKELGAPVNVQGDRLVISRRVLPKIVEKKLEFYVKEYVLCQECSKVDTNIATIGGIKMLVCEACGARRPVL